MTVGTTAAQLDVSSRVVIQNKGPGNVAWSRTPTPDIAAGPGIVLAVDDTYEFPGPTGGVYVIADMAGTDLRVERV
jgi:hypothetical protein